MIALAQRPGTVETSRVEGGRKGERLPAPAILVSDDDAALAGMVAEALQDEGYRVMCASTRTEAQVLLHRHGPAVIALVLSDAFASETDPYDWLTQVRGLTHGAVVLSSGRPATRYADHAAHGMAAFLAKPFDLAALLAVVTETAGPP